MLPGGDDPGYRALLAGPHHPYTRVEVWRNGVRVDDFGDDGLPLYSGAVSATLGSQVTRQLQLTTSEEYYPAENDALLNPYGNELRVFQGIKPGAGIPYEWPTFRGKIQDAEMEDNGVCSISATDRAAEVKDSGFVRPDNSRAGYSVVSEFMRLVLDGVPDATFGLSDSISNLTPILTWESDRGNAADDLSSASNAFWYALANGDYVMRFIPWTIAQSPLYELHDGNGGTLSGAVPRKSREDVYNTVVVVGERADGTTPVYAIAQDLDPLSPTYVGGGFGIKTLFVNAQAAANQSMALTMAKTTLRYASALTQSWTLTATFDPAMELGDCVAIRARGLGPEIQVVSSFSAPLVATQPMTVSTRALRPGSLED